MVRSVLAGICEAIIANKRQHTSTTNKLKFSLEIFAITSFSELLFSPMRKIIDLEKVPQDLRSRLYVNLDRFGDEVRTLIAGSGSGGVIPDTYSEMIMKGNCIK